ncbi:MAG: 16S rRNA (uracil(1498)-N(3))-methyltransferase [Candidatus Promineofilum sp.]|nr:16S rRNA (uracil(1498)-N(3))-methyltransferase [Promineifilum sp.]
MHRFFVSPEQIVHRVVRFDDDQARQMRRVLRLRPGDRVLALDGLGRQYEVTLSEVSHAGAMGDAAPATEATGEPAVRVTLYQSLLRREKFEWVLQKGTEIGVAAFVPVITRRSLVRDVEDVTPEKLNRWRRIIKEAAEQSGRGRLPSLSVPLGFAATEPGVRAAGITLIAWEGEFRRLIRGVLGGREAVADVTLFIGPEGGYEPDEIRAAESWGAVPVSLGRRILRTETAAVVGAALVLHELGEL